MDPKQFMLWGFLGTITILFTGLLIAHIIIFTQGSKPEFSIPWIFFASTVIILLSSYTQYLAQAAVKEDEIATLKQWLAASLILGLLFLVSQGFGWYYLFNLHYQLSSNTSLAFLYIISGIHAVHIIGGLVYLGITLYAASLYRIHSRNKKRLINCSTYWHFVDALWLYVFVVLLIFS